MLELLLNGELRPSRAWKMAISIAPFLACAGLVMFLKYARWNERRAKQYKDDSKET